MGFENPTVYVLVKNEASKLPAGLSKYLTWGTYLNGFDFYVERNGLLIKTMLSEKVTANLYKARQVKQGAKRAQYLDQKGFFDNIPPKQRKILG
jgi:hypothetical protein